MKSLGLLIVLFNLFLVMWWLMWGFILIDYSWILHLMVDHSLEAQSLRLCFVCCVVLDLLVSFAVVATADL